jgi:hypothetical protein
VSYEAQKLHLHDGNIFWGSRRRREEELGKDVFVMRNILSVTTIVTSSSAAPALRQSTFPPRHRSFRRPREREGPYPQALVVEDGPGCLSYK